MPFHAAHTDDIKLEDSNMWKVGSDEDKANRKKNAAREPQWEKAGKEVGVLIWRIEHFQVVPVPEEEKGKFHEGDSYVVLQTLGTEGDEKIHHIFFWLGGTTSIDEQGTAAYKTVELDDFMDGEPTEHREVQGAESSEFKALFPNLEYLPGGVDTGFRHVVPNDGHDTKLYHSRRTKGHVTILPCPISRDSIDEGDSFVLDAPHAIYVYHGKDSNGFERNRAAMHANQLEAQRDGKAKTTEDIDDEFWKILDGK